MASQLQVLPRRWWKVAAIATLTAFCMVALSERTGVLPNYSGALMERSRLVWSQDSGLITDPVTLSDPVTSSDLEKGYPGGLTAEMEEVLEIQKKFLKMEIGDYRFNSSLNVTVRSVVVTTWRSGSTFLGEVLNTVPGTWYHYEPLLDLGIVQVRGPPVSEQALRQVTQLLRCNYTGLDHHLEYDRKLKQHEQFLHNHRLWQHFKTHPSISWSPNYLAAMCHLAPVQSMKIVRLRLRLAEQLLKDPELNVRLLLLVRDPRGTLESRTHREWCRGVPDCSDPAVLCKDMEDDYSAAVEMTRNYPDTFRVVRYEDLSTHPYDGVKDLLSFFHLPPHPAINKYLDTHTTLTKGGVSSTFRNSKVAPFRWRFKYPHHEVLKVQGACEGAMRVWGYLPARNESHQKKLEPVGPYELQ